MTERLSPDIRGGGAVAGGSRLWRVAPAMERAAEPRLAGLTADALLMLTNFFLLLNFFL